jgi:hypothetical protein
LLASGSSTSPVHAQLTDGTGNLSTGKLALSVGVTLLQH